MSEILDNIYIWVFLVNIESVLLLALVKYMLCSHFTQNCILLYFLEAKNPYFVMKNCWKSPYICVFILSKKRRNWFHKNPHNSGMVGRRKLPDPSLNHIFNVLSTGAQYTLSFQWTDFGLKCLLLQNGSYTFAYFLIVSTIKMKVGQILVDLLANISNMFLAHSWRLETSSRPFQDFSEMTK